MDHIPFVHVLQPVERIGNDPDALRVRMVGGPPM